MMRKKSYQIWIVLLVLVLINVAAAWVHFRFDLTAEKRFTISAPVKKMLRDLPGPVEVDLLLHGNLPSGFRKLSASTNDLLQEFNDITRGKIKVRQVAPDEAVPGTDRTFGDTLAALGLLPINLKAQVESVEQSQYVFPSAIIRHGDKIVPVNLYPGAKSLITPPELNSAEAMLEYTFADGIHKAITDKLPLIAYSVGNGEPTGSSTYDLVENVLRKNYQVFTIDINNEPVIPDTFRTLVVVKPTKPFDEKEKMKIDQFIMHGGSVIWMIDRLEAEMDSLQLKNQVVAYDRNLQLEDLLFRYGARINADLVMDLQSDFLPFDVNGNGQFEFLRWNYFPLFEPNNASTVTKSLGLVEGKFVNSVDTVAAPGVAKTFLLRSSPNARIIQTPALISPSENRNAPEDEAFKTAGIPVAVLLEGKFTSFFKNRISSTEMDSLAINGTPFRSESPANSKMIIVGDGDIVLNAFIKDQPLSMGVNPYTAQSNNAFPISNRQFVENSLDYLVNNNGLYASRSKDYTLRLLDGEKIRDQKITWQLIDLLLPVLLIIITGLVYQQWRRNKYAR